MSAADAAPTRIVAIGRSVLTIDWRLLSDPQTHFNDVVADFYDRRTDTAARNDATSARSKPLGYKVTLQPATAPTAAWPCIHTAQPVPAPPER